MEREEAIEELKSLKENYFDEWLSPRQYDDKMLAFDMAIKALEKEPCEDAVSRKEVLEQTYNWIKDEFLRTTDPFDYLQKRVNGLPSVTPKAKWIPVSEKMPKKPFGCLVTVEEDDIHGEPFGVIYPDFVGYDGETWNDADGKVIPFDVIAWMPLPEPYNEEMEIKK